MTKKLLLAVVMSGVCAGTLRAQDGNVVLDETSYCRAYIQFGMERLSPSLLKSEGKKLLDQRQWTALEREYRKMARFLGKDKDWVTSGKWMDEPYILHLQVQGSADRGIVDVNAYTAPPPAGWHKPGFDDSAWVHKRFPLMVGHPGAGSRRSFDALDQQGGCFRFHFNVSDPQDAGDVTLNLVYHGGARVSINGKEIARGHLPAGEIGPDTTGADYPLGAYVRLNPDGSMAADTSRRRKGQPVFLGDIYGTFEDAPKARTRLKGDHRYGRLGNPGGLFTREDWERVQKARDRVLGPIVIPGNLLKKGNNVLAVEIRSSDLHPICAHEDWRRNPRIHVVWFHGQIVGMELRATGKGVRTSMSRPEGVQVWVEDIHQRLFEVDFNPRLGHVGKLEFTGAANGTYNSQFVIGTDRELTKPAVVAGDLKSADGSILPASAMSVSYAVPEPAIRFGEMGRHRPERAGRIGAAGAKHLIRKVSPESIGLPLGEQLKILEKACFHDHLSPKSPTRIAPNTCRPVWVTLKVPADTKPGRYTGSVKVSAGNMAPVSIPVVADIFGFRIPSPSKYQIPVTMEQNPYAVAEQYKVALWSDEHFRLMEGSFRQLGRVGNDWLWVPVIRNTELGSMEKKTPIRWIRKKNGGFAFDFSNMDRYIALARKHWGRPRVICFLVMHGGQGDPAAVRIHDEGSGKDEWLALDANSDDYLDAWRAFATTLYSHMQAKGLDESMFWGYRWDGEGDKALAGLLRQVTPEVAWASGGHGHGWPDHYKANSFIYKQAYTRLQSKLGWKRSDIMQNNTRGGGTIIAVMGNSPSFGMRMMTDRVLVAGANGVARWAADWWNNIYFRGVKAGHYLIPGMSCAAYVLWPGQNGAESSARFEAILEGTQEAEVRIFLEQATDRNLLSTELAEKARDVLFRHNKETLFVPDLGSSYYLFYHNGWRERSRRLYRVAAEAAAEVGLDVGQISIVKTIPAQGKKTINLRLRNWTNTPREWTVATEDAWLVPAEKAGRLAGHTDLAVLIDATKAIPGTTVKGRLVVTDKACGKAHTVDVSAAVSPVFAYEPPTKRPGNLKGRAAREYYWPDLGKAVFNVTAGKTVTQDLVFLNRAAGTVAWKASASKPWLKVEPSSGTSKPGSPIVVKVTATPPDGAPEYDCSVTIRETGGAASRTAALRVYRIPPYAPPKVPEGVAVPLETAAQNKKDKKATVRGKGFERVWGYRKIIPYVSALDIEGKAYSAFSVKVGIPDIWAGPYEGHAGPDWFRINFEILVDGKIRAQTGMMGPKDAARLMVVRDLGNAKTLQLRVRPNRDIGEWAYVIWGDPTLYK